MSAKTNKKSSPQPQIRNAADFKSMYVNFVQTAASAMDISIGVGEGLPSNTGIIDIEMKARLVMVPLQAKVLVGMIAQAIRQYEEQFGEIAIPSALSDQLPAPRLGTAALEKGKDSTEGD
jgi:hypothetical protein